jgi:hypothetical protein
MNANNELVPISEVLEDYNMQLAINGDGHRSRDISSNVTHSGDIDAMQTIRFDTCIHCKLIIFIALRRCELQLSHVK